MSSGHTVPFSPEEASPPAEWKLLLTPAEMEHVIERLAVKLDAYFASEPKEIVFVAILSVRAFFFPIFSAFPFLQLKPHFYAASLALEVTFKYLLLHQILLNIHFTHQLFSL